MGARGEPTDVGPQKAAMTGRMHVILGIGGDMMMAVMARPPQRAALRAGGSEQGERELASPAGLKRTMRKIAVIPPGDGEHPDEIEDRCHPDGGPTPSHPEHPQTHEMDGDNGHATQPVDSRRALHLHMLQARPGIDPPQDRQPQFGSLWEPGSLGQGQDIYVVHVTSTKLWGSARFGE